VSCAKCTLAQSEGRSIYPVRVGTGNVFLLGCETHVADVMDALRSSTRSSGPAITSLAAVPGGCPVSGPCANCGNPTEHVQLCRRCGKIHRAAP